MSNEQWTGVTAKATDSQVFADGQLKERSPKTTSPHVLVDTHTEQAECPKTGSSSQNLHRNAMLTSH